jgi:hypothetical protein
MVVHYTVILVMHYIRFPRTMSSHRERPPAREKDSEGRTAADFDALTRVYNGDGSRKQHLSVRFKSAAGSNARRGEGEGKESDLSFSIFCLCDCQARSEAKKCSTLLASLRSHLLDRFIPSLLTLKDRLAPSLHRLPPSNRAPAQPSTLPSSASRETSTRSTWRG